MTAPFSILNVSGPFREPREPEFAVDHAAPVGSELPRRQAREMFLYGGLLEPGHVMLPCRA